jgi:hypothetical protein
MNLSHIYIHGDYSIIDDRIIFCTYYVLLTTHVCTALYDRFILLVCKFWTAYLYLRSYLFELLNRFSKLCKWYTVGNLRKIRNFFMLKLFSNFQWFKFNFENRKHSKTRLKRIFNLFSKTQIGGYCRGTCWKLKFCSTMQIICAYYRGDQSFKRYDLHDICPSRENRVFVLPRICISYFFVICACTTRWCFKNFSVKQR